MRRQLIAGQHLPKFDTSCGKKGYASQRSADFAVRRAREHGERVHPYFCVACKYWHVGH